MPNKNNFSRLTKSPSRSGQPSGTFKILYVNHIFRKFLNN